MGQNTDKLVIRAYQKFARSITYITNNYTEGDTLYPMTLGSLDGLKKDLYKAKRGAK